MSSDRELTVYRQTSSKRFDAYDNASFSTSPSPVPSLSKALPDPSASLFNGLLFHRERVYKDSSALVERSPRNSTAADEGYPMASHSRTKAPVSERRGRSAKKTPTKSKGKGEDDSSKKRPASQVTVRPLKVQKTEANTKKKVDGLGGNALATSSANEPIVIDSDSDDDTYGMQRDDDHTRLVPQATKPLLKMRLRGLGSESSSGLGASPPTSESKPIGTIVQSNNWSFNKVDSESEPDMQPDYSFLSEPDQSYMHELQQLRQELEAAKAETESTRRLTQHKISDLQMNHARLDSLATRRCANLEVDLETERDKLRIAIKERDQLRIEVNISKAQYDNLSKERDQLRVEAHISKTRYDDLVKEQQNQKRRHEKAQKDHESVIADMTRSTASKIEVLQNENIALKKDNPKSFTTSSSANRSTLSPVPSSSYSDEEKKTENIRKTYIKVKRRFDTLHAIAVNLSTCTRSMDLSSFGEFGQYLRQLKVALEEDGQERSAAVGWVPKQDDK